jgi:hypothetical protein
MQSSASSVVPARVACPHSECHHPFVECNKEKDLRTPCPALNCLANHGYLPHDGKNMSDKQLVGAVVAVFGLSEKDATRILQYTKKLNGCEKEAKFSFAALTAHNAVEHDASLFHCDYALSADHDAASAELLEDLIRLSRDGKMVGWEELAQHKRNRIAHSKAHNSSFEYSRRARNFSYVEMVILLNVLGRDHAISVEHLQLFVGQNRIPEGFAPLPPGKSPGLCTTLSHAHLWFSLK